MALILVTNIFQLKRGKIRDKNCGEGIKEAKIDFFYL